MWIRCIVLSLATLLPGGEARPELPDESARPERLSAAGLNHHEVLRIDRDFGQARWEIVLDGWLSTQTQHLEGVRLWWVNTADGDRRKLFGWTVRRALRFDPTRRDDGSFSILLEGDDKAYRFHVELESDGRPAVFATVRDDDGRMVEHCRCFQGRLIARRTLGIPVGIDELRVRCTDAKGKTITGVLPHHAALDSRSDELSRESSEKLTAND